eukprot:13689763-Alexandrium_andersonii.AAC.1
MVHSLLPRIEVTSARAMRVTAIMLSGRAVLIVGASLQCSPSQSWANTSRQCRGRRAVRGRV